MYLVCLMVAKVVPVCTGDKRALGVEGFVCSFEVMDGFSRWKLEAQRVFQIPGCWLDGIMGHNRLRSLH